MEDVDKKFQDILVSSLYKDYKEVIITINKKPFLVKVPIDNIKGIMNA
jgi:hypothetical protein